MIQRNPEGFSRERHDLLIIGGGIYGACLALEAARRGLRCLLLERDDFGGATSWNSLRILHGGLRYLQTLDLSRFRESVAERRWFCRNFPELVRPLPCLMPLYGRGMKRKAALGPALRLNDWLSSHRNDGVVAEVRLAGGHILDAAKTKATFPQVQMSGLEGGGCWHDAVMVNSQRVLVETLRWACAVGARALNYVEAREVMTESGKVIGVRAWDRLAGQSFEFRADTVINCAGPWSRQLAATFDRDVPSIFHPSLAFNVFVARPALAATALAVQPARPGAPVYFMHPVRHGIMLGTIHAPWRAPVASPTVDEPLLERLIADVNLAVRDFNLQRSDIKRVFAGLLPAAAAGGDAISKRPAIHVHARNGGPQGLVTICGVKFTTARLVAAQALSAANSKWHALPYRPDSDRPAPKGTIDLANPEQLLGDAGAETVAEVARIVREESVTCADDLILRRADWALDPKDWTLLVRRVAHLHPELPLMHGGIKSPDAETAAAKSG